MAIEKKTPAQPKYKPHCAESAGDYLPTNENPEFPSAGG